MLRQPYSLGGPQCQARGAQSEMASSPMTSRAPKEGGNAMLPLHSRGSPTPNTRCKTRSGPQQRGRKSQVVASTLQSRGPERGRKCYVTPAFLGIPNGKHGGQNHKLLPHPCRLGGRKGCGNATCAVHSRGSPTPNTRSKTSSGPQQRRTKSEVVASTLPPRGPERGRKCYVTPAFSRIPNKGEQDWN